MSFFSDINGLNAKAMKMFETKEENKENDCEFDFCLNGADDTIFTEDANSNNSIQKFDYDKADIQAVIEEYMYNYNMTAEEAEDYISKNINTEG